MSSEGEPKLWKRLVPAVRWPVVFESISVGHASSSSGSTHALEAGGGSGPCGGFGRSCPCGVPVGGTPGGHERDPGWWRHVGGRRRSRGRSLEPVVFESISVGHASSSSGSTHALEGGGGGPCGGSAVRVPVVRLISWGLVGRERVCSFSSCSGDIHGGVGMTRTCVCASTRSGGPSSSRASRSVASVRARGSAGALAQGVRSFVSRNPAPGNRIR